MALQRLTEETVRALAAVNGLSIPEERLPLVLREYQNLLRAIAELNRLPLSREAEPALSLPIAPPAASDRRG